MEGLIPLVCRSINRSRKLRRYDSLPSAAAEDDQKAAVVDAKRHRRHDSFPVEYYYPCSSRTHKAGKLDRFGSQKIFSCLKPKGV
ncbi:unnamed protein product [Cuscuta campestris]|uniref:Uncharacterized protein n=1 Tax=Cuscuta campestris TaxID=132261 RepID=A0A484M0M9_9ASTE|nr:unnamed protein product [Cuscuta campestris]